MASIPNSVIRGFRTEATIRKAFTGVSLPLLCVLLSACQTITRYQCNSEDWSEVGREDGAAGKPIEMAYQQHADECAVPGAVIDNADYHAGYQAGLATFCTAESGFNESLEGHENLNLCSDAFGSEFDDGFSNGLLTFCTADHAQRFGLEGKIYRGTCTPDNEQDFLKSYVNALEVALPQAVSEVNILESKSNSLQSQINYIDTESAKYSSAIRSAKKSGNEAQEEALSDARSDVRGNRYSLSSDQRDNDKALERARRNLENIQSMLAKWKVQVDS